MRPQLDISAYIWHPDILSTISTALHLNVFTSVPLLYIEQVVELHNAITLPLKGYLWHCYLFPFLYS